MLPNITIDELRLEIVVKNPSQVLVVINDLFGHQMYGDYFGVTDRYVATLQTGPWQYGFYTVTVYLIDSNVAARQAIKTKKFIKNENEVNNAIGSNINAYIQLRFGLEWKIAKPLRLVTAFTYNHFSDGAVKLPNLGINTMTGTVGLIYYPNIEKYKLEMHPV